MYLTDIVTLVLAGCKLLLVTFGSTSHGHNDSDVSFRHSQTLEAALSVEDNGLQLKHYHVDVGMEYVFYEPFGMTEAEINCWKFSFVTVYVDNHKLNEIYYIAGHTRLAHVNHLKLNTEHRFIIRNLWKVMPNCNC